MVRLTHPGKPGSNGGPTSRSRSDLLTPANVLSRLRNVLASSTFLHTVAIVRWDLGRSLVLREVPIRPLSREEIRGLEELGNSSSDWSRVWVADGFYCRAVRQSSFHGDVILGRFTRPVPVAPGVLLPSGIEHSTLANCVVGPDVLIRDVKLLANYVVGEESVLLNCGTLTCASQTSFGNGTVLPLGPEVGGREVPVYAEIDVEVAATVAFSRHLADFLREYQRAVAEYSALACSPRGVIGPRTSIRNTAQIENTYFGPNALVDGATAITDSTLLSDPDQPVQVRTGACVSHSLLQWGSRVETMALLERSVLTESAHAERQAKVTASIVGPNTGVAVGEVTSSLLGPFVGFHHQALLIATLWPEGKGNVSSGVNAGANHTSKAPDQEFLPGEGLFLGLGASVKYPADFSRAPYTLIACNVTTLPQQVAFPFSLISVPSARLHDLSLACNQIQPAWMLLENLYCIKRREAKFRTRNQARRTSLQLEVFRPSLVDLMRDSVRRLEAAQPREVYTERDVEGLGKNYLLEEHRLAAIEAYRFFIHHATLLGLKQRLEELLRDGHRGPWDSVLSLPVEGHPWEHQRRILQEFGHVEVASALPCFPRCWRRSPAPWSLPKPRMTCVAPPSLLTMRTHTFPPLRTRSSCGPGRKLGNCRGRSSSCSSVWKRAGSTGGLLPDVPARPRPTSSWCPADRRVCFCRSACG